MKVALIGATGLVGGVMMRVLEEGRYLPLNVISDFIPVASEKSVGSEISFNHRKYRVHSLQEALALKPDLAFFAAGSEISKDWAPAFAKANCFVIDNSSAWRKDDQVPLVIPEVNGHVITGSCKIIANPNCSTIQMVLVLAAMHREYDIKRLVVSTYQSVTGTGARAVKQLENERQGISGSRAYPHTIDLNLFPHAGIFQSNGYTTEETKLEEETHKILQSPDIRITSTVVRVPVFGGHSEAVNVEFNHPFKMDELLKHISSSKGVVLQDDIDRSVYPMPLHAEGRDEVFVGRVRKDFSVDNGVNLWIVADNLRKGSATNAIQIAAMLVQKEMLNA